MKTHPSTWSRTYYIPFTHSEKVGHSPFLIYSLAQSDRTVEPCEMLRNSCQDMKPKTTSSTITIFNRQTPTKSGFWFGFMSREADLLWFLIVHKKQKSQRIDPASTYKESTKAKGLPHSPSCSTDILKIKDTNRNEKEWEGTQMWFK